MKRDDKMGWPDALVSVAEVLVCAACFYFLTSCTAEVLTAQYHRQLPIKALPDKGTSP